MARVKDRKFDFKINILMGIIFLLGGIAYLALALQSKKTSNWTKSFASFLLSLIWFGMAYNNYKKSKKV